jgi:PPIC-type PPIASE domain
MLRLRRFFTVGARWFAIGLAFLFAGCGGSGGSTSSSSTSSHTTTTTPPATSAAWVNGVFGNAVPIFNGTGQSGPTVAKVGGVAVSRSAVLGVVSHLAKATTEEGHAVVIPLPPGFVSCVTQLEAEAKAPPAGSSNATGGLRAKCASSYAKFSQEAVSQLISRAWVLQSAKEEHLTIPVSLLRSLVEKQIGQLYPTEAKFDEYLKISKDTPAAMLSRVEQELLTDQLAEKVRHGLPTVNPGFVVKYYNEHKSDYYTPESRDLGFIHTFHKSTAIQVLAELKHGTSFRTVAKRLAGEQRDYYYPVAHVSSHNGILTGLKPLFFHEPALSDPIFKTPLHAFGPIVNLNLFPGYQPRFHRNPNDINNIDGYYVYRIEAIHPAHTTPLSAVKAELEKQLPEKLYQEALASYIVKWRARLQAKTDCSPGYVARKCRQHKPTPGEPAEDPYTLS